MGTFWPVQYATLPSSWIEYLLTLDAGQMTQFDMIFFFEKDA